MITELCWFSLPVLPQLLLVIPPSLSLSGMSVDLVAVADNMLCHHCLCLQLRYTKGELDISYITSRIIGEWMCVGGGGDFSKPSRVLFHTSHFLEAEAHWTNKSLSGFSHAKKKNKQERKPAALLWEKEDKRRGIKQQDDIQNIPWGLRHLPVWSHCRQKTETNRHWIQGECAPPSI